MTYVGQQPATTFDSGIQDRFTGLTTNTVTLNHEISAEEDILVVWNNIVQDKNTYSVGGTGNKTVTLGGTLVSGDVVTVYYLNKVMQSVNPTAGSVSSTILGSDILSGQTDIGADIADADLFLVDDGAGGTVRKSAASRLKTYVGDNTPAFRAKRTSSNQTISNATTTKIQFNGEDFDTDSAFDSSTNYRFTVPSGEAGKYFFNMRVLVNSFSGGTGAGYYIKPMIYKNGSVVQQFQYYDFRSGAKDMYGNVSVFLDLSASDYIEGYIYNSSADSNSKDIDDHLGFSCLEGFKVTT